MKLKYNESTVGHMATAAGVQPLNSQLYSHLSSFNPTPFLYFNAPWKDVVHISASKLLNTKEETVFQWFLKCAMNYCYEEFSANQFGKTKLTGLSIGDPSFFSIPLF